MNDDADNIYALIESLGWNAMVTVVIIAFLYFKYRR